MSSEIKLDAGVHKLPTKSNVGKIVRIKKPKLNVAKKVIQSLIEESEKTDELQKKSNTGVLSDLNSYIEEPFEIIQSYFKGQYLERLVRHQIESYNHFINYQIYRTIQMFNTVVIRSENDYIPEKDLYLLEIEISFNNFKLYPPQIHENNGATKVMLPDEAKLRNFTYSSTMTVDLNVKYTIRNSETMDNPRIINKVLPIPIIP